MVLNNRIAVIIPSYKVSLHIKQVVDSLPDIIDYIIVVDDKCPEGSGNVAKSIKNNKLTVIYHDVNKGVGGAVVSGYKKALEFSADICIKVDGDGQMDSKYIPKMVQPLVDNSADYTKGNRFRDFVKLKTMPKIRLFGNSGLSFLVKASSGYWNIIDPTNGYTAIHKRVLEELELENLSERYFFESDMLIQLNIVDAVVKDISMPAIYGEERSSLNVSKILFDFPQKLLKGFVKRVFLKYFVYDFNMASVYSIFGIPMVFWGFVFGVYRWYLGAFENIENSTGTIMLSVLPLILGMQFLIAAISIDIDSIPKKEK